MAEISPVIEAGAVPARSIALSYGIYWGFVSTYVHIIKSIYSIHPPPLHNVQEMKLTA
jgi:hypothetical protein